MLIQEESFLGLDLSTQSLTAVLISLSGGVTHQFSIPFDDAYPSYHTRGGVLLGESSSEVFADPRMWAQALDDILLLLKNSSLTGSIRAIGVSAQQHGTVYLKRIFEESSRGLIPPCRTTDKFSMSSPAIFRRCGWIQHPIGVSRDHRSPWRTEASRRAYRVRRYGEICRSSDPEILEEAPGRVRFNLSHRAGQLFSDLPVDRTSGSRRRRRRVRNQPSRHSIGPLESEGLGRNCSRAPETVASAAGEGRNHRPSVTLSGESVCGFKSDAWSLWVPATNPCSCWGWASWGCPTSTRSVWRDQPTPTLGT